MLTCWAPWRLRSAPSLTWSLTQSFILGMDVQPLGSRSPRHRIKSIISSSLVIFSKLRGAASLSLAMLGLCARDLQLTFSVPIPSPTTDSLLRLALDPASLRPTSASRPCRFRDCTANPQQGRMTYVDFRGENGVVKSACKGGTQWRVKAYCVMLSVIFAMESTVYEQTWPFYRGVWHFGRGKHDFCV